MKKLLILLLVLTSCAVTYETPRCELMLRGEPCLTDHRCCNPPQTYHYQTYPNYHWWYWNKPTTNYVIIKPNKPGKPNNRPNRPNNKPNNYNKKKKR